ncbi:hypothetical protein TRIUR3_14332 [Triticum urartu]|uniref:Uncharacterized protein n=1 Tax=Triticum urartu TaxID=4572 RepID=M7ZAV3_TRIUA|nr:hypothetical protein TRIUR3_14332 [Triticum urartu]
METMATTEKPPDLSRRAHGDPSQETTDGPPSSTIVNIGVPLLQLRLPRKTRSAKTASVDLFKYPDDPRTRQVPLRQVNLYVRDSPPSTVPDAKYHNGTQGATTLAMYNYCRRGSYKIKGTTTVDLGDPGTSSSLP